MHISFDIDSLDSYYISSMQILADNGLYPIEIIILYKYLVELNPELGDINKTMDTINFLLKLFIT